MTPPLHVQVKEDVKPVQLSQRRLRVADVFCPDRDYFAESRAAREQEIQKDREQRAEERREDEEKFKLLLQNSFKF